MRTVEFDSQHFSCEVCGERAATPTTMGLESDRGHTASIELCHGCGPIDLDLMQLCREVTIGCAAN
jgi:hypothetical protein